MGDDSLKVKKRHQMGDIMCEAGGESKMNKRERKKKKMKMRMKRIKYCTHSSSSSSSVSSATDYTTSEEDNDGRQLRGSTSAGESGTGCVFTKAVFQQFEKEKKNPHVLACEKTQPDLGI